MVFTVHLTVDCLNGLKWMKHKLDKELKFPPIATLPAGKRGIFLPMKLAWSFKEGMNLKLCQYNGSLG